MRPAVQTIRINTSNDNAREWDAAQPLPMLRDGSPLGIHADYNRDDYVFLRAQTRAMQTMVWENRLKPIGHWGSNMVANLAWEIFA